MNPSEVLRIVDTIHRDKNIDKEIVFEGIEAALVSAAKKHFGEDQEIVVQIDRTDGSITGTRNGAPMDPTEMAERIGHCQNEVFPGGAEIPFLQCAGLLEHENRPLRRVEARGA